MTNIFETVSVSKSVNDSNCKGLVFRCIQNDYMNNCNFVSNTKMILLRRRSCSGCANCYWMNDSMNESLPILPEDLKHKALYELRITNTVGSWETNIIEDYDLEFFEIKG